jgi:hypothetical protein
VSELLPGALAYDGLDASELQRMIVARGLIRRRKDEIDGT